MTIALNDNIILKTDSYKFGSHFAMYPKGTQSVYSYFECRRGSDDQKDWETVFYGLEYILKRHLTGKVLTQSMIDEAKKVAEAHMGSVKNFNLEGWQKLLDEYDGILPLSIRALPEGTVATRGTVLFVVEVMDDDFAWLTSYVETILSEIWYPITVATLSRETKKIIKKWLTKTGSDAGLDFMLHDFGFRGASSFESAGIGGSAHLINFKGTDTLPALMVAREFYGADLTTLAYSVPASEHSIMSAKGREGEKQILSDLLDTYPTGILSVVADTYNIYDFCEKLVGEEFKDRILARDGIFVVRPDSVTNKHPDPASEMQWIVEMLYRKLGGTVNEKGYKVLNPKVRVLWGDGINPAGVEDILRTLEAFGYAAENVACFGMGGGLLQKLNRDTLRCAFKASAIKEGGVWRDIMKDPLDSSKKSKTGRFSVVRQPDGSLLTVPFGSVPESEDLLTEVFSYGTLVRPTFVANRFDVIRKLAAL